MKLMPLKLRKRDSLKKLNKQRRRKNKRKLQLKLKN